MYLLENPTDRSLHEIQILRKKSAIEDKINDIEGDYKELNDLLNLKLRTVGVMARKLLKTKYKVIV